MDLKEFKEKVKIPFRTEYEPKVKAEGYSMNLGIGRGSKGDYSLEVRLQPLEGSPDPIADDLFDRIKNEILPNLYEAEAETERWVVEVHVVYMGMVYPRQ